MSRAPALIEDATRHDLRPYEAAFILGLSVRQLGHRLTRGDIAFGYAGRLRRIPIAVVRERACARAKKLCKTFGFAQHYYYKPSTDEAVTPHHTT
ncbi:MAG: hypothetical protein ACR2LK_13420 [Solirubrobacteraceae bacterium]